MRCDGAAHRPGSVSRNSSLERASSTTADNRTPKQPVAAQGVPLRVASHTASRRCGVMCVRCAHKPEAPQPRARGAAEQRCRVARPRRSSAMTAIAIATPSGSMLPPSARNTRAHSERARHCAAAAGPKRTCVVLLSLRPSPLISRQQAPGDGMSTLVRCRARYGMRQALVLLLLPPSCAGLAVTDPLGAA